MSETSWIVTLEITVSARSREAAFDIVDVKIPFDDFMLYDAVEIPTEEKDE